MKTIQFSQTGKPADVLKCIDKNLPEPGNNEVRIKVLSAPINPSDLLFVEGKYGTKPNLPSSVGLEGVGIVDSVGSNVKLKIGSRFHFRGLGAWSEYIIVNEGSLIAVPDGISDEVAAQLYVNPFTAFALIDESKLRAGDWLLITAANSALSKLIIQICKLKGINTIGTVRRDDATDYLKKIGLTEAVNTETENLVERTKEITRGQGAKCVIDAVGGPLATAAINSLSRHGLMLVYGLLDSKPSEFSNSDLVFRDLTIKGFWLAYWGQQADYKVKQETANQVLELLKSDEIELPVYKTYKLEDISEAVTHANEPGRSGKILLKPF